MKSVKLLSVITCALAILAAPAFADQAACCKKAKDEGKTCEHKCCVKAAKDGKECEKCGGKGDLPKK